MHRFYSNVVLYQLGCLTTLILKAAHISSIFGNPKIEIIEFKTTRNYKVSCNAGRSRPNTAS